MGRGTARRKAAKSGEQGAALRRVGRVSLVFAADEATVAMVVVLNRAQFDAGPGVAWSLGLAF